jgi:hypothetical protein
MWQLQETTGIRYWLIGSQDTNKSSEVWRSGNQDSGNELSIYIALIASYKLVSGEEQGQYK